MTTNTPGPVVLPATCPHCHAPADFSEHHQIQYCNRCGKKVLSSPNSPNSPLAPTAIKATGLGDGFSTPPRGNGTNTGAVGTPVADEEDDIVTFKHSMQSPPPPTRLTIERDVDPTPLPPSRTLSHFASTKPANPSTTTTTGTSLLSSPPNSSSTAQVIAAARQVLGPLPPTPSSAASPKSASATAAASASTITPAKASSTTASTSVSPTAPISHGPNVITLTEDEFASLESTIREEMKTAHNAETEILTMEFDALSREYLKSQQEKLELQKTMDEMMESFNKVVDDANARKNDFTAQTGILESEMTQLRAQFQAQKQTIQTLTQSNQKLQQQHDELTVTHTDVESQLQKLHAENELLKEKYEKLHKQAQDKLGAAAQEYRNLMAKNSDKDAIITSLTADVHLLKRTKLETETKLTTLESSNSALQQLSSQMETLAEAKTQECTDLRQHLLQVNTQCTETRAKLDEASAIGNRYRDQVLELREKIRTMEEVASTATNLERESSRLELENQTLAKENQQLKSQLFDSIQIEKALKLRLESSSSTAAGGSGGGADAARCIRLEQELATLRANLNTKENEHKELMAICTDLISQVETLKGQQGS